jgi:hypothetical protein
MNRDNTKVVNDPLQGFYNSSGLAPSGLVAISQDHR